jgi:hypothetical protein
MRKATSTGGGRPQPTRAHPVRHRGAVVGCAPCGWPDRERLCLTTLGLLAKAAIAAAQAVLVERGEWALNEKGIVERAGLDSATPAVSPFDAARLGEAVAPMRAALSTK